MKTISVSFIAAGLMLPSLVFAQGPDRGRDHPQRPSPEEGGRRAAEYHEAWRKADIDSDGLISKGEFDAMPRIQNLPADKRDRLFGHLDKDGDGFINHDEIGKGRGRGRGGPRIPHLSELDTDQSGGISLEEFAKGEVFKKLSPEKQRELFDRLDTNGDQQITPKDRPEPPRRHSGQRPGLRHLIRLLDQNGDETLTFDEFREAPFHRELAEDDLKKAFEQMDRNDDDKIGAADMPAPGRRASRQPPADAGNE